MQMNNFNCLILMPSYKLYAGNGPEDDNRLTEQAVIVFKTVERKYILTI